MEKLLSFLNGALGFYLGIACFMMFLGYLPFLLTALLSSDYGLPKKYHDDALLLSFYIAISGLILSITYHPVCLLFGTAGCILLFITNIRPFDPKYGY
jgi:hypothetical protein